jgi:hypothetical protein
MVQEPATFSVRFAEDGDKFLAGYVPRDYRIRGARRSLFGSRKDDGNDGIGQLCGDQEPALALDTRTLCEFLSPQNGLS